METANRNLYEESGKELRQAVSMLKESESCRTVIVNPQLRNEELLYQLNGVSSKTVTGIIISLTSDIRMRTEACG